MQSLDERLLQQMWRSYSKFRWRGVVSIFLMVGILNPLFAVPDSFGLDREKDNTRDILRGHGH